MKFRKELEKDILFFMGRVTKGGGNKKIYTDLFSKMNDNQFNKLWESIKESGYLPVFVDNFNQEECIDYDNIVEFAKELKIPLEQKLIITDPDTGNKMLTPYTALVGICEIRKQRQIVAKKISVAAHDYDVEDLTGQPTGDSKAGGISSPELNVLIALGLTTVAKELADVRGGDLMAYRTFKNDILSTGNSSVQVALKNGSGVKSLSTAHYLFRGQHLENNLNER